jgi:hypothetical protein
MAKEVMEGQGWKNVINAGGYETHRAQLDALAQ